MSVALLAAAPCHNWSLTVGAVPVLASAVVLSSAEPHILMALVCAKPDTKVVDVRPAIFWVAT